MFITNQIKNKKIINHKGFTLIEVLVAMAIFSIGILAVGSMQLSATRGSSSARLSTEAVAIAQAQAETLILLPYAGVNPGQTSFTVGAYTVVSKVWQSGAAPPWGTTDWGVTPAANTSVIEVRATSQRGNRTATITFVKGQDI